MATKRHHEGSRGSIKISKKSEDSNGITNLSQELLLKTFTWLPFTDLLNCRGVSRLWDRIASDDSLWRSHYEEKFGRLMITRSTRESDWLDKFRQRYNWHLGKCGVRSIPLFLMEDNPEKRSDMKSEFFTTCAGGQYIFYLTRQNFLTVIDINTSAIRLEVDLDVIKRNIVVTELSAHYSNQTNDNNPQLAIGTTKGDILILDYMVESNRFVTKHSIPKHDGIISPVRKITCNYPIIAALHSDFVLTVYRVSDKSTNKKIYHARAGYFSSENFALAIDSTSSYLNSSDGNTFCVSIAHNQKLLTDTWSVCLQEFHFRANDELAISRMAKMNPKESSNNHAIPTCITYKYPYLLTGHENNNLSLYCVSSTPTGLRIKVGEPLPGHTSGVEHINVGKNGKAISMGKGYNFLRWDLDNYNDNSKAIIGTPLNGKPRHFIGKQNLKALSGNFFHFDEDSSLLVVDLVDNSNKKLLMVYDFTAHAAAV